MLIGYETIIIDGKEVEQLYINGELVFSKETSETPTENEG